MFDGSDANLPCVALNDLRCGIPLPSLAGKFTSLEGLTSNIMTKENIVEYLASRTRDAEIARVCSTYIVFNVMRLDVRYRFLKGRVFGCWLTTDLVQLKSTSCNSIIVQEPPKTPKVLESFIRARLIGP